LKDIAGQKLTKRTTHIVSMTDEAGNEHFEQEGIAEVFASFCEHLYAGRDSRPRHAARTTSHATITPFTMKELLDSLRKMQTGKAADTSGIVAEMLKQDTPVLHSAILDLFNDVLTLSRPPPDQWNITHLTMIFKKGDPKLPGNYRPIAIIPILYKLFSRMLCQRIQKTLLSKQPPDQAAYRPGYSTEDHLATLTLVTEMCKEWNVDLWLGLIDFEKAFDTVEHDALWKVLDEQGVHPGYVTILQHLYDNQVAYVSAGTASRQFGISRGVKQGDPISALLFVAVMEACFGNLKKAWNTANTRRTGHYFGLVIDDIADPLTNLRFADDVLLFAHSKHDIVKMIKHLRAESSRFGLSLHLGKTKILTNVPPAIRPAHLQVGESHIHVLRADESERYLGRKLSLDAYHESELSNRVAAGWAAFHKYKTTLCNTSHSLAQRLHLFETVVTPTVLYCASTWTAWATTDQILQTVRRRMLRSIVQVRRARDETWVDYIQRATHKSEELAAPYVSDWAAKRAACKAKLVERIRQMPRDRWCRRVLEWTPWFRCSPKRRVGHPALRWLDDVLQ
jgi:hypothetical protein